MCRRPSGRACIARSAYIVAGRPVGGIVELERPHVLRKRRTGR